MCVILELMFLSFYCDYIVDEIAVFAFLQFFSEIVNFRWALFSAAAFGHRKLTLIFGGWLVGR
jgi:hypothetical protein